MATGRSGRRELRLGRTAMRSRRAISAGTAPRPGRRERHDNDVSILMGNGNGTFRPAGNYAVGIDPVAIATGDFSGDGRLDLAVVDERGVGTGSGRCRRADGQWRRDVPARRRYPVGYDPDAIVAGDFSGDGVLDLAVANEASDDVSILMGRGKARSDPPSITRRGRDPARSWRGFQRRRHPRPGGGEPPTAPSRS